MATARLRATIFHGGGWTAAAVLAALAWSAAPALCADPDLMAMSLEELMGVPVTSVAPFPQALADTAAATYVITAEDIRRSGARTVPELLRQVPGMDVARINASTWAVSARGMTGRYASMLLVMVDGRTVYSPEFGGVFWEALAIPLDEIERIEVVRGPGGTLWGANAVNGVIDIVTRPAAHIGQEYTEIGAGSRERVYARTRRDVHLPDASHLRISAQAFDRDAFDAPGGGAAHDGWRETRGGFRWDAGRLGGALTVQGGGYSTLADYTAPVPSLSPPGVSDANGTAEMVGGHAMLHWRADQGDRGWQVRAYVNQDDRRHDQYVLRVQTEDLEVRHRRAYGAHDLAWGLEARRVVDRIDGTFTVSVDPERRTAYWLSGFLQDEVSMGRHWRLTLGTKLEHNSFTGLETQPTARLTWRPHPQHTIWWAASRAVRVPMWSGADFRFVEDVQPGTPPTVTAVVSGQNLDATELVALESGYRGRVTPTVGLDIALFANRYDHMNSLVMGAPYVETSPAPAHLLVPLVLAQGDEAETFGAEASATWRALDRLRLTAAYTWLKVNVFQDPAGVATGVIPEFEGNAPQQQLRLAARADLPGRVALDGAVHVVDQLPALGVPAYVLLDLHLGWEALPGLTFSIAGQNLLARRQPEFAVEGLPEVSASEVPRTVYGRVTWAP